MSGILAQGARFHLWGTPRNYALTNQHIELIEENAEKAVVFDWKQDYYMEYVTQVVNDYDTADILIRQLLLQYLSSEFVMNTENLEEYIKYTREANNISQKYLTYGYETEKMDSEDVKNISGFREKANEAYTDIDNLKLGGDAFVNVAKIYENAEVEIYEKALSCYIDALHAYYYRGGDNALTAVGEKEIWLALKDTYLKISLCENLRDTKKKGAKKTGGGLRTDGITFWEWQQITAGLKASIFCLLRVRDKEYDWMYFVMDKNTLWATDEFSKQIVYD